MRTPNSARPHTLELALTFGRVANWVWFAFVLALVLSARPELATDSRLIGLVLGYVLSMGLFGRTRLIIHSEPWRNAAEYLLTLLAVAAGLAIHWSGLSGLLIVFPFVVFVARLVLPTGPAVSVLLAACLLGVGLIATGPINLVSFVDALGLIAAAAAFVLLANLLRKSLVDIDRQAQAAVGHDELTGLMSRMSFFARVDRMHAQATINRVPHAVQIVDIENLKAINDRYGYSAGDRVILLVAHALQRLCTNDELLARYDGDKFVLFLPRLEGSHAEALAKRIRSAIFATTVDVDTEVVRIKANVGTAKFPVDGITLPALTSAAERDMKVDQGGREVPKNKPVFRRRNGKKSA
jgi:diguanylate cyclase (GGDEF)-like protein